MKINISIDDVTIHPRSNDKVIQRCDELIEKFPDIKFSLFIPTSYWRTQKPGTVTDSPLNISSNQEFCNLIKNLPEKNFEIGYHGHHHGIPGKSDNDEFQYLSYEQTMKKIDLMFEEVHRAGLSGKFKKIFRPPAWRLSPEAFRALSDSGFEIFALTDLPHIMSVYNGAESKYRCTFSNQYPPFRPLNTGEDKCGIVYHACEWDKNYLNIDMKLQLESFLIHNDCEFVFLEGLL